jgi:hypothetical protein
MSATRIEPDLVSAAHCGCGCVRGLERVKIPLVVDVETDMPLVQTDSLIPDFTYVRCVPPAVSDVEDSGAF